MFSIVTPEGVDPEDYNFDISINDEAKGYLGFEGNGLRITGNATFGDDEREVSFTAPIHDFRLSAEFIAEDNKDVIEINKNA